MRNNFPPPDGFFPIPGFLGYYIAKDSRVFSARSGNMRKPQVGSSGYLELSLTLSPDNLRRVGIHRLLGLTFLPFRGDLKSLVINHLNGKKHDNRLENLEWVTYQENAEHAGKLGLTSKCIPVTVVNGETFVATDYPSATECSKSNGISKDMVLWRLRYKVGLRLEDGNYYIKSSDKKRFFEILKEREACIDSRDVTKPVLMLELLTGRVTRFSKLYNLALHLKVSPSTITAWVNRQDMPVLPTCVQIKYEKNITPWREVVDIYSELIKFTKNRAVVVTSLDDSVTIHETAINCCKSLFLHPTQLSYRLRSKGTTIFKDGLRYAYLEDAGLGPIRGVTPVSNFL